MQTKTKKGLIITAIVLLIIVIAVAIPNIVYAVLGSQKQYGESTGFAWSVNDTFDPEKHIAKSIEIKDDDFKILTIADLQRKNGGTAVKFIGTNLILDIYSEIKLKSFVKEVNPDLLVLMGDNVATKGVNDLEMKSFVKLIDSFEIPWLCTFGNHDDEGRADKAKLVDILKTSKYAIFDYGPQDLHGAGNYAVNLTRNGDIVYSIYIMDTGTHVSAELGGGYDRINKKQIEWYDWMTKNINQLAGHKVPNIAFNHIPVPEIKEIKEEDYIAGSCGESHAPSEINDGFFDSFKANGGTHLFFGHDHSNNFYANYEGVIMGYAQKSSINGSFDGKKLGGTLFTLKSDNKFTVEIKNW